MNFIAYYLLNSSFKITNLKMERGYRMIFSFVEDYSEVPDQGQT